MNYEAIRWEKRENIAIITFNRPEAMNAVNSRLWLETGTALKEADRDPEVRVVIITGAGDKAFCAGADLKEFAAEGISKITPEMRSWGFAGVARNRISKPVIAAVNGFAYGGGLEIVLSCDLVVASEKAAFGLPEVKHGLIAAEGGLLRLPKMIPVKVALHAIMTGRSIPVEEAKQWGLVNEVVPHGQVLEAAIRLAQQIAENGPLAVRISKEIVYRGMSLSADYPSDGWKMNDELNEIILKSEDAKEGPRAFAERRKPVFVGR